MKRKIVEKEGYVFRFEGRNVFVGTPAVFSNIAAQMLVHEKMKPLKWKTSNTWMNMVNSQGDFCLGVGYRIPFWVLNPEKKIISIFG